MYVDPAPLLPAPPGEGIQTINTGRSVVPQLTNCLEGNNCITFPLNQTQNVLSMAKAFFTAGTPVPPLAHVPEGAGSSWVS